MNLVRQDSTKRWVVGGLGLVMLGCAVAGASVGSFEGIGMLQVLQTIGAKLRLPVGEMPPAYVDIVWNIRLPRIAAGLLVGCTLSVAGAVLQGLFRNPLADPGLIGVSSGGAVGAVLVIVFGGSAVATAWGHLLLPVAALCTGVVVTYMIYRLAQTGGRTDVPTMLLAGIAVNALAGSVIGLAIFSASSDQVRLFVFWSLGDLSGVSWRWYSIPMMAILTLAPLVVVFFMARPLNALLLGESEAFHVGVNVERTKTILIVSSALMVAGGVAYCGIIAFIGLVVPHLARMILGPDHRFLLAGSAFIGGGLLVLADTLARTLAAPATLPLGVVTAIVGGPFFLYLIWRSKQRAWAV